MDSCGRCVAATRAIRSGTRSVDLGTVQRLEGLGAPGTPVRRGLGSRLIRSCHTPGSHRYLVAGHGPERRCRDRGPKLKTHYKGRDHGHLKNLVGVIGDKNWLPHYRIGEGADGGDEMPPIRRGWQRLLVRGERLLQDALLAPISQTGTTALPHRATCHIGHCVSHGLREDRHAAFGPGKLVRNDTAWRMALDLNQILHYASADGRLTYAAAGDSCRWWTGIIGDEGDGPLAPRRSLVAS